MHKRSNFRKFIKNSWKRFEIEFGTFSSAQRCQNWANFVGKENKVLNSQHTLTRITAKFPSFKT